jgi:hypothetical protein
LGRKKGPLTVDSDKKPTAFYIRISENGARELVS